MSDTLRDAHGRSATEIKYLQIGSMAALVHSGIDKEEAFHQARIMFPPITVTEPTIITTSTRIQYKMEHDKLMQSPDGVIWNDSILNLDDFKQVSTLEINAITIKEIEG